MRRRRRRTLGALVGIALVVVVGVTIAHVNHAVNELTLPLSDAIRR
jgi:type VI protein secretion system component VasK